MIILSGVIHQEAWYTTTSIPDNYLVATSETGYSNAEAVKAATRMGRREFDKAEFLDQIDSIRQSTFKSSTIHSPFHATGLIPFNPSMVISKLREAVPVSCIPVEQVPGSCTPSTIPLSIPTLRAQGQELIQNAREM